jgi:MFS family permease
MSADQTELRATRPSNPFHWRFVTPMYVGSALNPVNSSLIATALVPMAHDIGVSIGRTAVLVSALYLASAIAQPTGGKLGEVFGPRRVFLAGIVLVLAGGIVGGLGQNLATLIVARVLIGVGTSGGYPSAMLIIRRRAQEAGLSEPPGRVLGGLQIAGMATAALGLPIGGVIVDAFGWRSTFLVNVPVAVIALVLVLSWLPADQRTGTPPNGKEIVSRIDLAGILLFAATLSSLLIFLDGLPDANWTYLGLAVVLGIALALWERTARTPFLDVRLLVRNLALTRTYLRFGLTALCVYTVLYGVSGWLEAAHGYSSRTVGLLLLPMSALSAILMGPVSSRNLIRSALIASAVFSAAGAIGFLLIGSTTPLIVIVILTLIFGVTLGTFAPANQTALYTQAEPDQIGTAAGLMRTFGYVGSIASSAIIGVFFHTKADDPGLHAIAAIMTAVSVVGLLFVLLDRGLRSR